MNWSTPVGNGVQPVRRGGANNSLFNRISGRTVNNAVLISAIDRILIKSSSTCTPSPPAHVFPSRSLRPLRSPPVLFHGLEDYDGDVYRPFVFDNNPVVSSDELPVLLWQTRGFRLCLHPYHMCVPSHFTSGVAHP
jgi:hypothetical protein